jgi:putative cardiolipin synthase
MAGCATLPTGVERNRSFCDDRATQPSRLADASIQYLQDHPGQSGFFLLADGLDAYAARVLLAGAADRTIDVQYYAYHDDLTGRVLTNRLLRAAERGVRVRLLLDDITTKGLDERLATLDAHPNLAVRTFNPFAARGFRGFETLSRFRTVTRRMHNKSFSVDDTLSIVGGRNIGDQYFGTHAELNFGDVDVLAVGPVAAEIGAQFDRYWNSPLAYPISSVAGSGGDLSALGRELAIYDNAQYDSRYAQRARATTLVRDFEAGTLPLDWGEALVYFDLPVKVQTDPADRSSHMAPQLVAKTVGALERELLIVSPYFVPGRHGTGVLTDLEKRDVEVRVLTNSLASTDVAIVHAGYAKYRRPLLRGGVEIYEFKPHAQTPGRGGFDKIKGSSGASLHAKTFVYDRALLFIGSANLDPRSSKLNTELGILIDSAPLAARLTDWFDANQPHIAYRVDLEASHCPEESECGARLQWTDEQDGRSMVYRKEPHTGGLMRLLVVLVSMLPIEGQL